MDNIKIYLDTCCYNRPYDIQSSETLVNETKAKLHIQSLVKFGVLSLVSSFILAEEISKISSPYKRANIWGYITKYSDVFVMPDNADVIKETANRIIDTGIKFYDAMHVACAVYAGCKYFISTDKRLLKYTSKEIILLNPIDFVLLREGKNDLR